MIHVRKPGLLTTVQDLGRPGYQRYGIAVGGAIDRLAARTANLIVGNDDNAAVLEMAQTGPELTFARETLVALCGGDFDARVGNEPLPPDRAARVEAGETVSFGFARAGLRAWLAVAGGIDEPIVLGSRSTYRRAGVGGHRGRPLAEGDELQVFPGSERAGLVLASLRGQRRRTTTWTVRPDTLGPAAPAGAVRAVRGPEWEWFTPEARQLFFAATWLTTREADRMGVRLDGPALALAQPREMISAAVNAGVVQVPPAGRPIVLLPSRQSIGGYPRIAAVAAADVRKFAQLRPGEPVRFQEVSLAEAHRLHLARERDLNRVRMGLTRMLG